MAGFYTPDGGEVWFGERGSTRSGHTSATSAWCSQNYALLAHMTVRANIAYGLKLRKLGGATIAERVAAVWTR